MSIDYQIILIACTGVIALYSLLVLIFGPVRTRGYKKYQSLLKDEELYKYENKTIDSIWKRDKRKLSNLKGFETAAFIIDLILSLGCCALLILLQIGRLDDKMIFNIIYAGFAFILIAFIFQFAYIWLLGSIFYRHFYDAKYKYDYYNMSEIKNETFTNLTDIFHGAIKTSKLMATSLPFAILFLLIIAATGFFYYKFFEEKLWSEKPNIKGNEKQTQNQNVKENEDQNQNPNQNIIDNKNENIINSNHNKSNSDDVTGNDDEKPKNDDVDESDI